MVVLPNDHDKKPDFDLGVLGGRLCMINYDHDCHSGIWAWEGNNNKKGSNWFKLMRIPSDSKYLAPVFLMKNGEIVLRIINEYYIMNSYSPFCFEDELTLLCRDFDYADKAVQERMDELQQHSTTTTREYNQEVKPVICEHLLSEFGPHCKSSTSQVSLQWTIELDPT
ncbi:hypothetical protein QYF36_004105 [Acer negundo]|nr:hypothetical protein QYF36_004105 [Acer negundo]